MQVVTEHYSQYIVVLDPYLHMCAGEGGREGGRDYGEVSGGKRVDIKVENESAGGWKGGMD